MSNLFPLHPHKYWLDQNCVRIKQLIAVLAHISPFCIDFSLSFVASCPPVKWKQFFFLSGGQTIVKFHCSGQVVWKKKKFFFYYLSRSFLFFLVLFLFPTALCGKQDPCSLFKVGYTLCDFNNPLNLQQATLCNRGPIKLGFAVCRLRNEKAKWIKAYDIQESTSVRKKKTSSCFCYDFCRQQTSSNLFLSAMRDHCFIAMMFYFIWDGLKLCSRKSEGSCRLRKV